MELLSFDKTKYKKSKKVVLEWQDEAALACKFLIDSKQFTGSIFQKFKQNQKVASIALIDCKELNKPYSRYFLKVFNEIKKKQE